MNGQQWITQPPPGPPGHRGGDLQPDRVNRADRPADWPQQAQGQRRTGCFDVESFSFRGYAAIQRISEHTFFAVALQEVTVG